MASLNSPQFNQSYASWCDATLIRIAGGTAGEFLQGYLTCDTERLTSQHGLPMAICNVKGRVIASGWAVALDGADPSTQPGQGIGLIVHSSLAQTVAAFLKPYITFSSCEFCDPIEAALFVNANGAGWQLSENLYVSDEATLKAHENSPPVAELEDASKIMNDWLIERQFAFISEANSARFLPQMLKLHERDAVDFDKGCYLGQEIVARAQFRGAVKRTLTPISWTGSPVDIGQTTDSGDTIILANPAGALAICKVTQPDNEA